MSKDKKTTATKEPKILDRCGILDANDLKRELVEVEEWGGSVYVHTLTGAERDSWEREMLRLNNQKGNKPDKIDTRGMKARLIVQCVKDELGKRIFGQADVSALQEKNGKAIDRLFLVAQRMSGLSDDEVEELAKN